MSETSRLFARSSCSAGHWTRDCTVPPNRWISAVARAPQQRAESTQAGTGSCNDRRSDRSDNEDGSSDEDEGPTAATDEGHQTDVDTETGPLVIAEEHIKLLWVSGARSTCRDVLLGQSPSVRSTQSQNRKHKFQLRHRHAPQQKRNRMVVYIKVLPIAQQSQMRLHPMQQLTDRQTRKQLKAATPQLQLRKAAPRTARRT